MPRELRTRASVLKAVFLYTVLFGSLTVGGVYLSTRSGAYVLVLAAVGLTLVTFIGGTGDVFSSSAAAHTPHVGGVPGDEESGHGWDPSGSVTGSRSEALLLYGIGLVVWSVLVLVLGWWTLV